MIVPHTLYQCHASAGAGKTHRLVEYYLVEALKRERFSHILAITFTNKAAREMKARILSHLSILSEGGESLLAQGYMKGVGCEGATLKRKATKLLQMILHDYNHFAVSTLDHFFHQSVNIFRDELGLKGTYGVTFDEEAISLAGVEALFNKLGDDGALERALATFAFERIKKGKTWHFVDALLARSALFFTHDCLGNGGMAYKEGLLVGFLADAKKYETDLSTLAKGLLGVIAKREVSEEVFAWGERGVIGFLKNLTKGIILTPNSRVRLAAEDVTRWTRKGEKVEAIEEFVEMELHPLLVALLRRYDEGHRAYATTRALTLSLHEQAIMVPLLRLMKGYSWTHNLLSPTFITALFVKILKEGSIDFFYERLNRHYSCLLVDECQDLSRTQWDALHPLLMGGLAEGGYALLVGDVKQSIYRWRGGDARLFLEDVEGVADGKVVHTFLPQNFRSQPAIVEFTHLFFRAASQTLATYLATMGEEAELLPAGKRAMKEGVAMVQKAYAHVQQKVAATGSIQGYVAVQLVNNEGNGWKALAMEQLIGTLESLQKRGYAAEELAILVRDHKEVALVVGALDAYQQKGLGKAGVSYEVVTSSGLLLKNHPAIALLVAALHYMAEPDNPLGRATLLHHFCHYKGITGEALLLDVSKQKLEAVLPNGFVQLSKAVTRFPLTSLVATLVGLFVIQGEGERAYVEAFQDHVAAFPNVGGDLLHDFLTWWARHAGYLSLSGSRVKKGIPLMTIHQAKGLAFDVVLLPFGNWDLDHPPHSKASIWSRSGVTPFDQVGEVRLDYGPHLVETFYQKEYIEERHATYLEGLNLLYVGCTRAKKGLYIWTPATVEEKITNVGRLINQVVPALQSLDGVAWNLAAGRLTLGAELGKQQPLRVAPDHAPDTFVAPLLSGLPTHHQDVRDRLSPLPDVVGSLWHELLAEVEVATSLGEVVERYVQSGRLTPQQGNEISQCVATWWKWEELRDWFGGGWQVKREGTMLLHAQGNYLRLDRVMLKGNEAVVLDFKTGMRKGAHHMQVVTYMKWLREMGYTPVRGYLFYIKENDLVACDIAS